jgi:tetratricopeptide (TPR) repeat protein
LLFETHPESGVGLDVVLANDASNAPGAEAGENLQQSLALSLRLAQADPSNVDLQRDLSIAYVDLGRALSRQHKTAEAGGSFQQALGIANRSASSDSDNKKLQQDLSKRYVDVALASIELDQKKEAVEYLRQALAVTQRLANFDMADTGPQRDLSILYRYLGETLLSDGEFEAALINFYKALSIEERLVGANGDTNFRIYNDIGLTLARRGNLEAALENFGKALSIKERLAGANPNSREKSSSPTVFCATSDVGGNLRPIGTIERRARILSGDLASQLNRWSRRRYHDRTFRGPMPINMITRPDIDRAIVAIHDLDTGIAKGPQEARMQLEQKLGAVAHDVELAIKSAGRSDLKLFWTALLVRKAEQLPWVKYPSPSRFEQWCMLPFASSHNNEAEVVIRPKQAETSVFRSYLRDWVSQVGIESRADEERKQAKGEGKTVAPAPIVFLSFASEDAAWKANFVEPMWFGNILGSVTIIDDQNGDTLSSSGAIDNWVAGRSRSTAVFVAFISEHYIQKRFPLLEWHAALSEEHRKRLIFVPILLDSSAKHWWINLKEIDRLRNLGGDYAYVDFTDGSGKPVQINTTLGPVDSVVRRMSELARLIKKNLDQLRQERSEPAFSG